MEVLSYLFGADVALFVADRIVEADHWVALYFVLDSGQILGQKGGLGNLWSRALRVLIKSSSTSSALSARSTVILVKNLF